MYSYIAKEDMGMPRGDALLAVNAEEEKLKRTWLFLLYVLAISLVYKVGLEAHEFDVELRVHLRLQIIVISVHSSPCEGLNPCGRPHGTPHSSASNISLHNIFDLFFFLRFQYT